MCELTLQLSSAQDASFPRELIEPETAVTLSEMTV